MSCIDPHTEYGIGSVISVSYRDLYLFESEVSKLQRIIDGKEELIALDALMDRQYGWHSEELHIAVSAWSELYMLNPPSSKPPGGHKNYIKSWLKEKHPQLSTNAIERILVVVNPNPSGGASPTPE